MKKTIPVIGMACSACSANVERKLNSLEGVNEATVSLPGRTATVEYDPEVISLEQLKAEIKSIGYDLVIEENRSVEELEHRAYQLLRRKTILAWIFAVLVMAVSMRWISFGRDLDVSFSNQIALILTLAAIILCGRSFYVSAFRQMRHGTASMDTLVALSTAVAFLFSVFNTFFGDKVWTSQGIAWHTYFDAPCMIIAFVLTGRLIEERARKGMTGNIRALMGLRPKTARIVTPDNGTTDGGFSEIPIAAIGVGDMIEVRAGEKVPVDGVVTWAQSFMTDDGAYVDEAMMTGEPTPVLKRSGSEVLSGTLLVQGKLRFRARQVGEQTALANMIRLVQEAQGSKAPVQRMVDKWARIFVPVVIGISVLTFFLWLLIGGMSMFSQALLSAVSVLIIACPCAMGLATPTAIMIAVGSAARKNVLVKNATAMEVLRKVNAVVIDKTGTLTIANQQIDFTKADHLSYEERETLKPHVQEAVAAMQEEGIDIHLMSGDKDEAVRFWADKAGISHYQSGVKPQDKENLVRTLQQEGKTVAMIGDGVNDSQALAVADVSIAMGRGTDVAMDVAQVTLMGDDLRRIPDAIRLSRRTVSTIRQNLFWAFIYNIVCIPLAAGVPRLFDMDFQITPAWAAALMAFSSISVVLNSLRLLNPNRSSERH